MKIKALFFSRGRGHGHAMPDIAIAEELSPFHDLNLTFASYSTGASTFEGAGYPVINLGLPENNPYLPTLFKALQLIEEQEPDVIISHEEFAVLPAAHLCGRPAIFLSTWLPSDARISAESLAYADSILLLGDSGVFPVPVGVTARPIYLAPVIRRLRYTLADRAAIRTEMRLAPDAILILVIPGGAATEEYSPIADTVLSAYLQLPQRDKRLIWVSSKDAEHLRPRLKNLLGVEVMEFTDPIERLLVAADVVITKATHNITLECSALGVASISLSPNLNPIDDTLIPRIHSNIALNSRAVDGDLLLPYLQRAIAESAVLRMGRFRAPADGAALAAGALRSEILRLTKSAAAGTRTRRPAPAESPMRAPEPVAVMGN